MDILIKSFNRPYYLDRCLQSLFQYVTGYKKIILLEDGTPEIFLNKIQKKYPTIQIEYSKAYSIKSEAAIKGLASSNKDIPVPLWVKGAKQASDYFVLLEDDMWFTQPVNLESIYNEMQNNQVWMTKLFWLGNPRLIQHKSKISLAYLDVLEPKLASKKPVWYYLNYYRFHRLKWWKKQMGWYTEEDKLAYYTIYGVAGMVFEKKYFLQLWDANQRRVNENKQLLNAIQTWKDSNYLGKFAKTKTELIQTGFISAATNNDKEHFKNQLIIPTWNLFLNQLWLQDALDVMEHFPKDFSKKYIQKLITENGNSFPNWIYWHTEFVDMYKKIGCFSEKKAIHQ
jgi:glycosyltransferase involved in cell wall biosynthesis